MVLYTFTYVTDERAYTFNVSFERAAGYVRAAGVFDGDEIVAGCRRAVGELVTVVDLATTQLNLRRTVDGHRQRSGPGVHRVHDEPTQLTCMFTTIDQPISINRLQLDKVIRQKAPIAAPHGRFNRIRQVAPICVTT